MESLVFTAEAAEFAERNQEVNGFSTCLRSALCAASAFNL